MPLELKNLMGWSPRPNGELLITMEYIGGILSVNSYKTAEGIVRSQVVSWMHDLAWPIRFEWEKKKPKPPIKIRVDGFFKNHSSVPDLHNLHKVIGDAVEMGSGINDREFRFEDGDIKFTKRTPTLKITLSAVEVKGES